MQRAVATVPPLAARVKSSRLILGVSEIVTRKLLRCRWGHTYCCLLAVDVTMDSHSIKVVLCRCAFADSYTVRPACQKACALIICQLFPNIGILAGEMGSNLFAATA